jgi:signal transduction histidine kinase
MPATSPDDIEVVRALGRLASENARLKAALQAQVAELRAARGLLAEAALAERRRIERDLHDGLQHRLLRLSWLAERAGAVASAGPAGGPAGSMLRDELAPLLGQLADEARHTHVELRELARGIHPAILTEQGLATAVEEHALHAPLPVLVDLPPGRLAAPLEAAAFLAIAEALTNAVKHATAGRVTVRGHRAAGRLIVEVADDGGGGADPRRGSGLRGMRGRLAALGGTISVHSPPGRGTRVIIELPCG